jgi:hypothetical protein
MDTDLTHRKGVYRKLTELIKNDVDVYELFREMNIPKTINMNGITLNLSAISNSDIAEISHKLQNITYHHTVDEIVAPPLPEPPQVSEKLQPTYKPLRLTKIQKIILSLT